MTMLTPPGRMRHLYGNSASTMLAIVECSRQKSIVMLHQLWLVKELPGHTCGGFNTVQHFSIDTLRGRQGSPMPASCRS